ncbi:condensation domain-containing protein, partial [Streptomyces sp. NPDC057927]
GELYIGGVGLARGYYGNEELTKKSFIENPEIPYGRLYKTGDLCRYRKDQSIEYIGRKDFQVKIRGFRIELAEIEITMERQDYIKQCVVTSIQRGSDTLLAAYVTLNQPSLFSESKLRESLAASLPDYMIPSFIIRMDSFPLSMNGKVDRKNLPSPFTDFKIKEQGSIKTKWERRIASIWEDLLQLQGIGTEVPFLRVGGNSLFAARLVNRIREDLKINVSLKEIFDYSTIKQQALLVGESNRQIVSLENRLVNIQGKIPLSDAQKRLWFINKLEGDSPLYNLPHYIKIQGNLNVLALKESVRKVILQHEIFKYRFIEEEGIPYIHLDNREPDEIEIVDLSGLNPEKANEKAFSAMMQDAREAFDFENGPFYRINLYRLSSENFILYFNFHHIISDGWSDDVFKSAVFKHYSAIIEGHLAPNEPSIQYQDYILSKENLNYEKDLDFWELQLPKNNPAIHLHAGSQASRSSEGMEEVFNIAPEQLNRLKIYCEENGYTLFMGMLALYKIFIHRLSLEKYISVGTPVAGRKSSEQEQLIGFFVNTVVIRDKINSLDTFGDFLRQVKESTLDAFSHDEVPFEKVVERIKPNRGINETPLFQYMFSFLDTPETSIEVKGLEVGKSSSLHNATSKFDLTLTIEKETKSYIGKWEYRTECYTEEIVKGFTRMFQNLLDSVVENPEQEIQKLSLLSEEDK